MSVRVSFLFGVAAMLLSTACTGGNSGVPGGGVDTSGGNSPGGTPPQTTPPVSNPAPALLPAGIIAVRAGATGKGDGSTWEDAYPDLQPALAAARLPGASIQQIWVSKGTYTPVGPGGSADVTIAMVDNVALYGGFAGTETALTQRDVTANPTILSGDINRDDGPDFSNHTENSRVVVEAVGLTPTSILDGFTITGGSTGLTSLSVKNGAATVRNCTITGNRGGSSPAAFVQSGSAFFTGCTFSNNVAINGGAGAVIIYNSDVQITDCTFSGNTGDQGGALALSFGKIQLTRCTFTGNVAGYGGGLVNEADSLTLNNCVFRGNQATRRLNAIDPLGGGGIYTTTAFTAYNCIFEQNTTATFGGAVQVDTNSSNALVAMFGCLIDGNQAMEGGAAYSAGGLLVRNCTITRNQASDVEGGLSVDLLTNVDNCIVWANSDSTGSPVEAQIFQRSPNSVTDITNSDIQGTLPADLATVARGTINADPLFVDPAGGNFRLQPNSPCVGTGQNGSVPPNLTSDLDGKARVLGSPPVVDMGAYEQ